MTALTKEQIKEIADMIDSGFICNWNIKSNKLIFLPSEEMMMGYGDTEPWDEDINEVDNNFDDFRQIEKPNSTESFKIMEGFIDTLPDNTQLKVDLIHALEKRKPFSRFKHEIDYSGDYRQKWFDFKNQWMIEWVEDRVSEIMEIESDVE